MIGRTYLERGEPVTVLARWVTTKPGEQPVWLVWHHPPKGTPRNVLIRREATGDLVVRPFRGLRRTDTTPDLTSAGFINGTTSEALTP